MRAFRAVLLGMAVAGGCAAQTLETAQTRPDPWAPLRFLEGTWTASANGAGGAKVVGNYAFVRELGGHVLARHSTSDAQCVAPASFDCAHGDLLYVFEQGPELKAIYFDNEGHTIHYSVESPSPDEVAFLSEPGPGPRFRLLYTLRDGVMTGKFQMQPPGGTAWRSYLEWSGKRR